MPGDTATFKVKLVAAVALEDQQNFAIREGGKTVGAGVVTKDRRLVRSMKLLRLLCCTSKLSVHRTISTPRAHLLVRRVSKAISAIA
jgi:hypothetical protein